MPSPVELRVDRINFPSEPNNRIFKSVELVEGEVKAALLCDLRLAYVLGKRFA